MPPLTQTIVRAWKRLPPVDCLIISPALELMGRQPINELSRRNRHKLPLGIRHKRAEHYRLFLIESLAGKRPGLGEKDPTRLANSRNISLNPMQTVAIFL